MPPMKVSKAGLLEKITAFVKSKTAAVAALQKDMENYKKAAEAYKKAEAAFLKRYVKAHINDEDSTVSVRINWDYTWDNESRGSKRVYDNKGGVIKDVTIKIPDADLPEFMKKGVPADPESALQKVRDELAKAEQTLDMLSIVTTDEITITSQALLDDLRPYMNFKG